MASEELEVILQLIEEEKFQSAVEQIGNYLWIEAEDDVSRVEYLMEKLFHIAKKGAVVIRTIIPLLLKKLNIKDDGVRYAFVLSLKPICETEYETVLPFSKELLNSDDPNVREGMLQLVNFIANVQKIEDEDIVKLVIEKMKDDQEFIRNKALQTIKIIGKNNPTSTKSIILESIKDSDDDFKQKCDEIIKSLSSIKDLEEKQIEKRELEVKEEQLEEREIEIKKEELEYKEKELDEKEQDLVEKAKDVELDKKEKDLNEKERELKEKELELKEKKLEVKEEEKKLEEKKIKVKEKLLEKEKELVKKEKEISEAELDLKEKELNEKADEVKVKETQRVEDKLKKIDDEDDENIY